MDELRTEIISNIRSCLISTKGQITLKQLDDDYRTLLGQRIPHAKLGFRSLEEFITSIPSLITWRTSGGEILVDAQVSEKSAHISSMIRKQKSAPTKKKVRIAPKSTRTYSGPPPATPKWRPKKHPVLPQRPYQHSPRLAAVSHNQFVHGQRRPTVASKIVVPESSRQCFAAPTQDAAKPRPQRTHSPEERGNNEVEVLSSTMRRISRIMDEISVERDSGNSSPTTEFALSFKQTGDPISDLRSFVAHHKLGEVKVNFNEYSVKQFYCTITVGNHKYSTYPEEFTNKTSAEKHASQKALDSLIQKYSRRKSLLVSSNEDVIERIPLMLEKHNDSLWYWQIEADYIDKYNEQLPYDWLRVIDSSPFVFIQNLHGGNVLNYCNPDDKGRQVNRKLNMGDVSVPCKTVHFDANNRLYAVVAAAHSANEIWCQDLESQNYEKFEELTSQMEKFYTEHHSDTLTKTISVKSCYVIRNDGAYCRVRALNEPQEGYVDCFLIDYGDQVAAPVDSVHVLRREFAVLESQAFVCRLAGLEKLYEVSADSDHMANIVGKEFVLENVVDETGVNDDITIPVVMYDVSTDKSLNEELITLLMIESATPTLNKFKSPFTEVYVTNIESNGDVYVQNRTQGYHSLMELLNQLEAVLAKDPPRKLPITPQNNADKMYLVRCKMSGKWRRAKILDWSPRGDMAQIYYVDYGNTEVITFAKDIMYPLEKLDDVINQYPPQAIKVRIMIDKIPSNFVEIAEKLLPQDQPVILKIMTHDSEEVAWVELYKRTADGVLVFINKNISVEAEFQNLDVPNNDPNPRLRLINSVHADSKWQGNVAGTVPSGGSLKTPKLPKIGDYFNVNIPFAVNPWNFCVQPLDSLAELSELMTKMQAHYKDVQFSPMRIVDVVPGQIYATKYTDGSWYRTSVLKVIHSGSISVVYCDFGYYTSMSVNQLVPLEPEFMALPYQALKAKIADIKPVKNKWTMEDCDVFRTLVTQKRFVSVVQSIDKDEFNKGDIILQLQLIDTSNDDKDIYVKQVLIEKGMAKGV